VGIQLSQWCLSLVIVSLRLLFKSTSNITYSRNYASNGLIPVTEIFEFLILWSKLEFSQQLWESTVVPTHKCVLIKLDKKTGVQ
jgi:hypothetical protein